MAVMQALSPPADLGAALRALRQTQVKGDDRTSLGTKCLHAVIARLAAEGVSQEDLQPLVDLELKAQGDGEIVRNRRRGSPPSDVYLARIAAVIDLLVKSGRDEAEGVSQIAMRSLLALHNELAHGLESQQAKEEYQNFTRELEGIPANERVKRIFDKGLWDRRRKAR
jgi:hypothetical protein